MQAVAAVVEKAAEAVAPKQASQYEMFTLTTWLLKVLCC